MQHENSIFAICNPTMLQTIEKVGLPYIGRAIPPIIPLELFEDVQEKIAKNKKAPARRKAEDDYLLTTKLFCG